MVESELIDACQNQNKRAQEIIFHKYAKTMMALCMRYSLTREDAEDALMETFVKVFKNIGKYSHQGSFEGWIKRIAIRTSIDKYNKHKGYCEPLNDELHDGQVDANIYDKLDVERLHYLISLLPDGYRFVFNLFVIEDMSHKEIAKLLNIEEVTSRSQLTKAKKYLKKLIKQKHI